MCHSLKVVKLHSTFCSVLYVLRYSSKWYSFSVFIHFSIRDLSSSYKDKTWDRSAENLWSLLLLLCLCWWYKLFLKEYHFYKKYGWYFPFFLDFSELNPNLLKCEITGIIVLIDIQVAVCGMHCVDLKDDALTILGTHFSYNKKKKKRGKKFTQR